ncbi:MAG: hypothetical protein JWO05_1179 [Gemmatimonadetes bacterium]|nr:hypothetical protein [Gemmatimonadota bacterium]
MFGFIGLVVTLAITTFGYLMSRRFTEERLRYVEAAQTLKAPIIAGVAAALLAGPVVWLLPIVGGGTALLFGVSVAMGVANGARENRRRIGA